MEIQEKTGGRNMAILWAGITGLLVYLELIYHFSSFGMVGFNFPLQLMLLLAVSGLVTLLIGSVRGIAQKILLHLFMWLSIVWTGAQEIYFHIFKQPLQIEAAVTGAGDALTNYYKEALLGFLQVSPFLLLMVLPGIVATVLLAKKIWVLPVVRKGELYQTIALAVASLVGCVAVLFCQKILQDQDYEALVEFCDPMTVVERVGVLPMTGRNVVFLVEGVLGTQLSNPDHSIDLATDYDPNASLGKEDKESTGAETEQGQEGASEENLPEEPEEPEEPIFVPTPHAYEFDSEKLYALADNKKKTWMADYFTTREPDMTNEYTGYLEGYNVIFLTAEGFSPYAVSEELTPTLYRLIHNGYYFENYYVPLWQTSTSDGEYINCTGLIPDGQFSMRKSSVNDMSYTLPGYFAPKGALCTAYHNNSLSYYDRYLSHNNLGYFFKACRPGSLDENEWADYLFEMEGAGQWPASDYNMMVATMDEYVDEEYFLTYYMTVSGHMNYNFAGNKQSSRNKDAVADLDMSENARAYKACHVELEKAMAYMLERLEQAGKLNNTLIVLSADHYPYAMTDEELEELAGKDVNYAKDKFRNNLILWTPKFEEEPRVISKACGSMDVLPTVLNLLGFEYDSRLYAGKDIFSENEGLVIFNDRSFVTDRVVYKRKEKEIIWITDENGVALVPEEEQEAYLEYYKNEVKARYTFSAYMLEEDYFSIIRQCVVNPIPEMPAEKRMPKKIVREETQPEDSQSIENQPEESQSTEMQEESSQDTQSQPGSEQDSST